MPKKNIVITHVYEGTFRIISPTPLDVRHIADVFSGVLQHQPVVGDEGSVSQVDIRELCFDQSNGDTCFQTEGHRGRHRGLGGNRWGDDL